jgi:hypothetical protein
MANDVRTIAERGPVTGEGLRRMREALNLTGRELANLLATNPETISRWQHDDPKPDAWAFVLVGSMVLDQENSCTTTRDRLTRIRMPGIEEVRRAIVDAVRPLVNDKRSTEVRRASDQKFGRQLMRELGIAPSEHLDPEDKARDIYERGLIDAENEGREKRLIEVLSAIDDRFVTNTAAIKKALQTARKNGAPATAARLAWDVGIEERAEGKKWKEMRATIEARYRKVSAPPRRTNANTSTVPELLAQLKARRLGTVPGAP